MKEVLLYGNINEMSSRDFINAMNETDGDIDIRINSEGGQPEYGWGMVAKISENKDRIKTIKVDGQAMSMACFALCYVDNAEGLDVSEYLIHRAAYPSWFEESEMMTQDLWDNLNSINNNLQTALKNTVDVKALEEMKGIKLKDVFSNESRIGVTLNAKEAKKVGLINKIVKLTPSRKAEIEQRAEACQTPVYAKVAQFENEKSNKMTVEELKKEHPELIESIERNAEKSAVKSERQRVEAFMVYADIAADEVKEAIEKGVEFTPAKGAQLARKAAEAKKPELSDEEKQAIADAKKAQEESEAKTVTTTHEPEQPKTEKEAFFAKSAERLKTAKIS